MPHFLKILNEINNNLFIQNIPKYFAAEFNSTTS